MLMETSISTQSKFIEGEKNKVKTVELKRTFSVPVEKLYACWADPKIFARWWKGLIVKEMNPSPTGAYRFEWEGTPGDYAEGRYEVLSPCSKIVFTWNTTGNCAGESSAITDTRVTLAFRGLGDGKSELLLRHEGFASQAQYEAHLEGWNSCIHDLARATDFKVEVVRQFSASL